MSKRAFYITILMAICLLLYHLEEQDETMTELDNTENLYFLIQPDYETQKDRLSLMLYTPAGPTSLESLCLGQDLSSSDAYERVDAKDLEEYYNDGWQAVYQATSMQATKEAFLLRNDGSNGVELLRFIIAPDQQIGTEIHNLVELGFNEESVAWISEALVNTQEQGVSLIFVSQIDAWGKELLEIRLSPSEADGRHIYMDRGSLQVVQQFDLYELLGINGDSQPGRPWVGYRFAFGEYFLVNYNYGTIEVGGFALIDQDGSAIANIEGMSVISSVQMNEKIYFTYSKYVNGTVYYGIAEVNNLDQIAILHEFEPMEGIQPPSISEVNGYLRIYMYDFLAGKMTEIWWDNETGVGYRLEQSSRQIIEFGTVEFQEVGMCEEFVDENLRIIVEENGEIPVFPGVIETSSLLSADGIIDFPPEIYLVTNGSGETLQLDWQSVSEIRLGGK